MACYVTNSVLLASEPSGHKRTFLFSMLYFFIPWQSVINL
jgi:hypothetical protein